MQFKKCAIFKMDKICHVYCSDPSKIEDLNVGKDCTSRRSKQFQQIGGRTKIHQSKQDEDLTEAKSSKS